MKQPNTITVAMMQSPDSENTWLAQVHLEYKDSKQKDVLQLHADGPLKLLFDARERIKIRLEKIAANGN